MSLNHSAARHPATAALLYILEQPDLASGFMNATGLRPDDLRALADTPELGLHVLDFLLEDDSRVVEAASSMSMRPQDLLAARTAIAGPGSYGWEAD